MRINLIPASDYKRETYGIVLVSETEHRFTGRGIHNPHHGHVLQVWNNAKREQADGTFLDPHNRPTPMLHSFEWAPEALVIAAHPVFRRQAGESLVLGDHVELYVHGFRIDEYVVEARPLHDPHLTPVGRLAGV